MSYPIIGLVSTYREGELAQAGVRSLWPCCKRVFVFEGPIVAADQLAEPGDQWPQMKMTKVRRGDALSDADKRTQLLQMAQRDLPGRPFWALHLDGDELLVNGANLPLWTRRAELEPWNDDLRVTGGFPLRLVELDGTTSQMNGRIYRGDLVKEFLLSSTQMLLKDGSTVVAQGNAAVWRPGDSFGAYTRPPLQGEPHILHLTELRDPARNVQRQSKAEVEDVEQMARRIGVEVPSWVSSDG